MKPLAMLLLLTPIAALAADAGDWRISKNADLAAMEVPGKDGYSFGMVCLTNGERCYWAVTPKHPCNDGREYSLLINGAYELGVGATCTNTEADQGTLLLIEFDKVGLLVHAGGDLSVAIPQHDASIDVAEFDISGVASALEKLQALIK